MTILVTIAFLLAVAGSFLLLHLSPFSFLEELSGFFRQEKPPLRKRILQGRNRHTQ